MKHVTRLYLLAAVLLGAFLEGNAQPTTYEYTWDGTNWVNGDDPTGVNEPNTANVLIQAGNPATIGGNDVTGETYLRGIFVEAGAELIVPAGEQVIVQEYAIFKAGATEYSQLLGTIIGDSTYYEIYLDDQGGRWHNLAFPMDSQVDSIMGIPINVGAGGGQDSANTNIYYYDALLEGVEPNEGRWRPVSGLGTDVGGVGFQIYAGGGIYGTGPFTVGISHNSFIDGDVNINVASDLADEWNFLPNPYPSILDWDEVYASTGLAATYYIQLGTPDTVSGGTNVQFVTYNASAGTGTGPAGSGPGTRYLAPGQSFFVQYPGTADQVVFTNSMRVLEPGTKPEHYKTSSTVEKFGLVATNLSDTILSDMTFVMFDDTFSDQKNVRVDGTKMMNSGYPNLYTVLNGGEFVYNGISNQFTSRSIDLNFQADHDGQYEITMPVDEIPATWEVELEDKLLDNTQNMRLGGYIFTHNTGNTEERFVLHINKTNVSVEEVKTTDFYTYVEDAKLNVSLQGLEDATVKIYDVKGTPVAEQTRVDNTFEADVSEWATGVYLIEVYSNGARVYNDKAMITSK